MTENAHSAKRTVALLKSDLVDWTNRSGLLGPKLGECTRLIHDAFETAVMGFYAEKGYEFFSGGDGGQAYFSGDGAAVRAVSAAVDIVERIRTIPGFEVQIRLSVGMDEVPIDANLAGAAPDGFNLAGHMVGSDVCPSNAVCITEDVCSSLEMSDPDTAKTFEFLGVTRRDRAPVFVHPAGKRPAKPAGLSPELEEEYKTLRQVRARYARPPFTRLRFFSLPQFNFVNELDLRSVYTPLLLRPHRTRDLLEIDRGRLIEEVETGDDKTPVAMRTSRSFSTPAIQVGEALRKSRSLVILGDPGSGKTTLLRYLAMVFAGGRPSARHVLGVDDDLLPIHTTAAELLALHKKDLYAKLPRMLCDLLSQHPTACAAGGLAEIIKRKLENGLVALFVDSLDEIPDAADRQSAAEYVEEIAHEYPGCRYIVASRVVGYPGVSLPGGEEFVVEPLTEDQARRLTAAFYTEVYRSQKDSDPVKEGGKKGASLTAALKQRETLSLFAQNPLLLSIAALVHIQLGDLPRYRVKLYDVAVQTLITAWAKARRPPASSDKPLESVDYDTEGRATMPALAYHMHENYPDGLITANELLEFIAQRLPRDKRSGNSLQDISLARDFLARLNNAGSLLTERGPGRWGFVHQTFQEYLAAKHLAAEDIYREVLMPHLYHARWEEVIRFTVAELSIIQGRVKAASEFVRTIFYDRSDWRATELHMNKLLAATCTADAVCDEKIFGEILQYLEVAAVSHSIVSQMVAFDEMLKNLRGSPLGIQLVRRLLGTQGSDGLLQKSVFKPLTTLNAREVIPDLIEVLKKDKNDWARGDAAKALENIGGREAIPNLIEALKKDNDGSTRGYAALALGTLGVREAIPDLIEVLKNDRSEWARDGAAVALGNLGAREAIPNLMEVLKQGEVRIVRHGAAIALSKLGVNAVIPDLIEILKQDKNEWPRRGAAVALGKLGAREAIPDLIEALKYDVDGWVRHGAANALDFLGMRMVIPELIEALKKDQSELARHRVAEVLGVIGVREAIPDLIEVLKQDKDYWARSGAAEALGNLAAREAIPDLIDVLTKDHEEPVRRSAAGALWQIARTIEET